MNEQPHKSPEDSEAERRLERELDHAHKEEEKLERELERVREREEKLEHEIDEEQHHHPNKKFLLIFIINGEDFKVETKTDNLLRVAVEKALTVSGNTGRRDPSEWEVRNSAGVLLEMGREIRELELAEGARLFLSLKVGAGGNDAIRS